MADVAVLGAGRMGSAIARRLAASGDDVVVWNRSSEPAQVLAASDTTRRIRTAATAADAVAGAEVVFCVLASGDAARAVLLDTSVLHSVRPGSVVVDLGTSGIDAAHRIAAGYVDSAAHYLDAPVSGSVPAVDAGTLLIMASGEPQALEAARPVLATLARTIVHLGPAGQGQAMKLAVNLIVHDLNSAVSEALTLALRLGVQADDAYDVLEHSVVAAPFVHYKRAAFLNDNAPVAMSLDLVAKDLRLITDAAALVGLNITGTKAVRSQVESACTAGYGGSDMAAVHRFLRDAEASGGSVTALTDPRDHE